jgi:hypothetical protein
VRGLQTSDPAYFCRPDPGSSNPAPESKSLLVLFFRKEQILLFLKKKKQKDFCSWCRAPGVCMDFSRRAWRKTGPNWGLVDTLLVFLRDARPWSALIRT